MQRIDFRPRVGVMTTRPASQGIVGLLERLQVGDGPLNVVMDLFLILVVELCDVVQIELREGL